jgi:CBS domain-containing protein
MVRDAKVKDYMTGSVIFVSPTTPVRVAHQLMRDNRIRHLPVVQEDKLVGILSSGDIRRVLPSSATSLTVWEIHALWDKVTVAQGMTRYVLTVQPETAILEAVRLMVENRFNSLPVVDNAGKLIGILTEVDVFKLLLQHADRPVVDPEQTSDYPVAVQP